MNITEEVELISPGFRRKRDNIHHGYWTPELAVWTDSSGFTEKRDLQYHTYDSTGLKVIGAGVNACPILCIPKTEIGENDLTVQITGYQGMPSSGNSVTSGGVTITGFEQNYQHGRYIYRRVWTTGGDEYKYSFTIPAHTIPGTIFKIPSKRIYKITNITVTPRNQTQPLTELGFYALADNGSKLLYSVNWNKIFDNTKKMLYGMFGHPDKCPRCKGSGYVADVSDTCDQCSGYGYNGYNASGYLLTQLGNDVGITKDAGDDDDAFMNKIWAMKWWVTPTEPEIQRYLAHFARIQENEVGISLNQRSAGTTGVESRVHITVPYDIPLAKFSNSDSFWTKMINNIEVAGVNFLFSFLTSGFTGSWDFEEMSSYYYSGYINAKQTGNVYFMDNNYSTPFGFHESIFGLEFAHRNFYESWYEDWFGFNYISGLTGDKGTSGTYRSGTTYMSGSLIGSEWIQWAWPDMDGAEAGGDWSTGTGCNQDALWDSGTYRLDNFWASGALTGAGYNTTGYKY